MNEISSNFCLSSSLCTESCVLKEKSAAKLVSGILVLSGRYWKSKKSLDLASRNLFFLRRWTFDSSKFGQIVPCGVSQQVGSQEFGFRAHLVEKSSSLVVNHFWHTRKQGASELRDVTSTVNKMICFNNQFIHIDRIHWRQSNRVKYMYQ